MSCFILFITLSVAYIFIIFALLSEMKKIIVYKLTNTNYKSQTKFTRLVSNITLYYIMLMRNYIYTDYFMRLKRVYNIDGGRKYST